ncbi:MAG: PAS domain S-box protein [Paludibacter sp.]
MKGRRNQDFSTINETFRMIAKNGEIKECETTSTLIEFEGQWASFFTIHDVTDSKRMQLELKESEEKYRQLFAAESDAIFMIDAETGQILDINPATTQIYGFSREELLKMKNTDVSAEPEKTAEATRNREPLVNHRLHRRKDGTIFPVELSAGFTTFKNRSIQIVTSRDISSRISMENTLRESESKYKTLIENSQDGIFAIVEEKILFANNTFCKIVGYTPEELYNKPASSLLYEEDQPRGLAIRERRKQGDHSTVNDIFRFVAKDGSLREADVFSSVLELNGQVVSYITVHDLTETRRMQEQLQLSEEKYRTVIDKATDGIVITQLGRLKFVNNSLCEMLQYQESELIEMPFVNIVVEEDQQVMKDFHKRRMEGEDFTALYRSRIIRKDGKIITVELNARTSNYNGNPAAFIIIRNITDRIKIENELQTAKNKLELLNTQLEKRVKESSESLTEARTQLINLQKENLQSQFDVLKQQVNPHFLFNSLNVLTSLIKAGTRPGRKVFGATVESVPVCA